MMVPLYLMIVLLDLAFRMVPSPNTISAVFEFRMRWAHFGCYADINLLAYNCFSRFAILVRVLEDIVVVRNQHR